MTVQAPASTVPLDRVVVPRQAGPVEPPLTAPLVPAPLKGRDRPLTAEERSCLLGLIALHLVLSTIVVVGVLIGHSVWS
jgi:hypothetical protein